MFMTMAALAPCTATVKCAGDAPEDLDLQGKARAAKGFSNTFDHCSSHLCNSAAVRTLHLPKHLCNVERPLEDWQQRAKAAQKPIDLLPLPRNNLANVPHDELSVDGVIDADRAKTLFEASITQKGRESLDVLLKQ